MTYAMLPERLRIDPIEWVASSRLPPDAWPSLSITPSPCSTTPELDAMVRLLREQDVRSYLEIGARYGGSFETVMTNLPAGSRGVVVDFPGGRLRRRRIRADPAGRDHARPASRLRHR
jgi:hypothetical protein